VQVDVNVEPIPRPEPLRAQVYRRVVQQLTGGRLDPGQTITEAGLSKSLGVSRTPVREALLQLEAEGVLESTPARGFTVRNLSRDEAAELFPILSALEALAVRSASGPVDLERLRELESQMEAAAIDPVRRWRLDTEFHETMVDACQNASLRALITRVRVTLCRYEIEYMRHTERLVPNPHTDILAALADGDLVLAGEEVVRNWQNSLDAVQSWLDPAAG
jgi:DNA-binding GntR family transcriptional regulator